MKLLKLTILVNKPRNKIKHLDSLNIDQMIETCRIWSFGSKLRTFCSQNAYLHCIAAAVCNRICRSTYNNLNCNRSYKLQQHLNKPKYKGMKFRHISVFDLILSAINKRRPEDVQKKCL